MLDPLHGYGSIADGVSVHVPYQTLDATVHLGKHGDVYPLRANNFYIVNILMAAQH